MSNPYFIQGPASINFSGGRTSAYMARQMQLAGSLADPTVEVIFADTGKERPETYEFILRCEIEWGLDIKVVSYPHSIDETPFEAMIKKERYLPNPVQRICTDRLKIKQIHRYMKSRYGGEYSKVIGLRADERSRFAKIKNAPDAHRIECPLYVAGVTKPQILAWWREQPFDLQLKDWEGNCDLCFLKGQNKKRAILRDRPQLADWWIRIERETSQPFRAKGPNYVTLLKQAVEQAKQLPFVWPDLDEPDMDDLSDCGCTD